MVALESIIVLDTIVLDTIVALESKYITRLHYQPLDVILESKIILDWKINLKMDFSSYGIITSISDFNK